MNRPTDPESAWQAIADEIDRNNTIYRETAEAHDAIIDYVTNLEKYADTLEAQLGAPVTTPITDALDRRIIELGNALADAQARIHAIGLLTR